MPCYVKDDPKLGRMFMCGKLGPHCSDCGWVSGFLCDYPVGKGKTCDRKMCESHATEIAPDLHYCTAHLAMWDAYRDKSGDERALANVVPFAQATKRAAPAACSCEACRPLTLFDQRMVLCEVCRNKRCPHATNHRNPCTGSNEPGQPGSSYGGMPTPEGTLP